MDKRSVASASTGTQQMFECDICNMPCTALKGLIAHKKAHDNNKPTKCHICEKTFRDHFTLQRHLKSGNVHRTSIPLQKNILHFTTFEEFKKWKVEMEKETKSVYFQHKGSRKNKDGTIVTNFSSYQVGLFHRKQQKSNSHCPSRMTVKKRDGIVVEFFSSHLGHTTAQRIPQEAVRNGLRDTTQDGEVTKRRLTNRRGLQNVINNYKLNREAVFGSNVKHVRDTSSSEPQAEILLETSDCGLTLDDSCKYEMKEDCESVTQISESTIQAEKAKVGSEVQEIPLLDKKERSDVSRKHVAPLNSLLEIVEREMKVFVEEQRNNERHRKLSSTMKTYSRKKPHSARPSDIA